MFKNISSCCLVAAFAIAVFAAPGCRAGQPQQFAQPGFGQQQGFVQQQQQPVYNGGSGTSNGYSGGYGGGGSGTSYSGGSGSR